MDWKSSLGVALAVHSLRELAVNNYLDKVISKLVILIASSRQISPLSHLDPAVSHKVDAIVFTECCYTPIAGCPARAFDLTSVTSTAPYEVSESTGNISDASIRYGLPPYSCCIVSTGRRVARIHGLSVDMVRIWTVSEYRRYQYVGEGPGR